jgi:DNA adenine methylase
MSMKLTALLPYFGGKRTMAPSIVEQLGPHSYYFEGCAGSMAVLFAKEPSEHEVCCDLHGGMTNLAWVIQDSLLSQDLFASLSRVLYSDELYANSKHWLGEFEKRSQPQTPHLEWAYHYFLASWMGRNGVAGTAKVNYQIATRWTKGGGSGPLRFKNAVESIPAWCDRLRYVHVLRRDLFLVLPKIEDDRGVSIYADPPYLDETVASNSRYLHRFPSLEEERKDPTKKGHIALAKELRRFRKARVVVSYYHAPQLQELYRGWSVIDCSRQKHLHVQNKRGIGKGMTTAPEVLLINCEPIKGSTSTPKIAGTLFGE